MLSDQASEYYFFGEAMKAVHGMDDIEVVALER